MRRAIRTRIVAAVPSLGGRVFEPTMPTAATDKPYAVVKYGGDNPTNISMGFEIPFQIWVYVERLNHTALDELTRSVIGALNRVELTAEGSGQKFALTYVGCSEDFYDDDWQALTRRIDFSTETIVGG